MLRRLFTEYYHYLIILALFTLAVPAEYYEVYSLLEDQTISFRQLQRMQAGPAEEVLFGDEIFVVNTDEVFFEEYGSFPLRRTDIGKIIANLSALGAKVVGVDMLMDFPSSYGEDPKLVEQLNEAGNAVLVSRAAFDKHGRFTSVQYPTPLINAAVDTGYSNMLATSSVVTTLSRLRIYPEVTFSKDGWPIAVQLLSKYWGVEPQLKEGRLIMGDKLDIPLDQFHDLYIDFPRLPSGVRFLSEAYGTSALAFLDLTDLDEDELWELELFVKDKIVLLGDTSEVSHDWFDTPVGMVYGVEIIADTIQTLLHGAPLRPAPFWLELLVNYLLCALLLANAQIGKRVAVRLGLAMTLFIGFVSLLSWVYVHHGVVLSMSYSLIAGILSFLLFEYHFYLMERNHHQQIAKTFGQYIPPELVDEMTKSGENFSVGGTSREMTVLFSDVRGFTTISESVDPEELTQLMNGFLTPMTKVIHARRGTIDKYMGDAVMAFWGAPLDDPEHARHAVAAGLGMIHSMAQLREEFLNRGWPEIRIGVGVNTGSMCVGNMGSEFRLAYTVLGDAVNLGSRLEGLTKQYKVPMIISETTQRLISDLVCRELDRVRVKGKEQPVTIFEPLGFDDQVEEEEKGVIAAYHEALSLYRERKWEWADERFSRLQGKDPEREIYRIYRERIAYFRVYPPPSDWDGVFTHTTK